VLVAEINIYIRNNTMVKNIVRLLTTVGLLVSGSAVIAGNHTTENGKEDLYHCGCVAYAPGVIYNWGTAYLEWSLLNVSKKSGKGHKQHEQYDYETCIFDLSAPLAADGTANYYRGFDDCTNETIPGIEACSETPQVGGDCSGPAPSS
jgi:hypothetical protein